MKRTATLLSLLLVLLIAVHPVVAFHFCSDSLASVQLYSPDLTGCCSDEGAFERETAQSYIDRDCCHTALVELAADHFVQHSTQVFTELPAFTYIFLLVNNTFLETITGDSLALICKEPPRSLYKTGRAILTRICVYII